MWAESAGDWSRVEWLSEDGEEGVGGGDDGSEEEGRSWIVCGWVVSRVSDERLETNKPRNQPTPSKKPPLIKPRALICRFCINSRSNRLQIFCNLLLPLLFLRKHFWYQVGSVMPRRIVGKVFRDFLGSVFQFGFRGCEAGDGDEPASVVPAVNCRVVGPTNVR